MVWDSLMNYDRIERKRSLKDLARAPDMAYMKTFSKNLVYNTLLVVTWMIMPKMGNVS